MRPHICILSLSLDARLSDVCWVDNIWCGLKLNREWPKDPRVEHNRINANKSSSSHLFISARLVCIVSHNVQLCTIRIGLRLRRFYMWSQSQHNNTHIYAPHLRIMRGNINQKERPSDWGCCMRVGEDAFQLHIILSHEM